MATKHSSNNPMPGLKKRGEIWHIDKRSKHFSGGQLRCSTRTSSYEEAEALLIHKLNEARKAKEFGIRPKHNLEEAAVKYVLDNQHLDSIEDIGMHLMQVIGAIGNPNIDEVNNAKLSPFVKHEKERGIKDKSINNALGAVRALLNAAANDWYDDNGLTWLAQAPKIKMLKVKDSSKPYPLSWEEQAKLFKELPDHLAEMSLFKVNCGNRESNVCRLKWEWEVKVPELDTSVFIIPKHLVKNDEERLTILNRIARSIISKRRQHRPAKHLDKCKIHNGGECNCAYSYVFTYKGLAVNNMRTNAWVKAWERAGLTQSDMYVKGVHNLRHTFARRLRAAGVNFETRQALLGHTNGNVTTDYSAAEIEELINAVELLCGDNQESQPTLTVLKLRASA